MAVLQDININVHGQPSEKRLQTFLRLSQNENGRMINFRVLGPPLPSGCTATFSGTKPDGNVYSKTGTVAGNFVIIQEDMQMTAVAGVWDAKLDIINGSHNIMTALIRVVVYADVVDPDAIASDSQLQGLVAEAKYYAEHARTDAYGSPLTAPTKAQMTDHTRVYVYTGSEPNMVAGNWYLWDGTAWISGGVYNSVAVQSDSELNDFSTNPVQNKVIKAALDQIEGAIPEIDATLSTAGKAADAKKTGDEIASLKEDLNNIEPGLSDDAIIALLACFRNVAWTATDSKTYYDALENALYKDRIKLDRIIVSYVTDGHTVQPWDALDSLRQYITVTAIYSDSSQKNVSDYVLSGTLENIETNVLTIEYQDKTATINVATNIDTRLAYWLTSGRTLDGVTGLDTGVVLSDTNKSVSIVADFTDEEILNRVRTAMFASNRDPETTWASYQMTLSSTQSSDVFYKKYGAIGHRSLTSFSRDYSNETHHIKMALIHYGNTQTCSLYMNVDGNVEYDFVSLSGEFIESAQTLFVGQRPDGGYTWKGTINLFNIYAAGITMAEAKDLLGVA